MSYHKEREQSSLPDLPVAPTPFRLYQEVLGILSTKQIDGMISSHNAGQRQLAIRAKQYTNGTIEPLDFYDQTVRTLQHFYDSWREVFDRVQKSQNEFPLFWQLRRYRRDERFIEEYLLEGARAGKTAYVRATTIVEAGKTYSELEIDLNKRNVHASARVIKKQPVEYRFASITALGEPDYRDSLSFRMTRQYGTDAVAVECDHIVNQTHTQAKPQLSEGVSINELVRLTVVKP